MILVGGPSLLWVEPSLGRGSELDKRASEKAAWKPQGSVLQFPASSSCPDFTDGFDLGGV